MHIYIQITYRHTYLSTSRQQCHHPDDGFPHFLPLQNSWPVYLREEFRLAIDPFDASSTTSFARKCPALIGCFTQELQTFQVP